jgi:hypothetical protein
MMMMIYHKFDELLIFKLKNNCVENIICYHISATFIIFHKHNTKEQPINLLILINNILYFLKN